MPADAWLLLVSSVGAGLGLELLYIRARWTERSGRDGKRDRGPAGPPETRRDEGGPP